MPQKIQQSRELQLLASAQLLGHAVGDEGADDTQSGSTGAAQEDTVVSSQAELLDPATAHGGVEGVGDEAQDGGDGEEAIEALYAFLKKEVL